MSEEFMGFPRSNYPGAFPSKVEDQIRLIVESPCLHLFSGTSNLKRYTTLEDAIADLPEPSPGDYYNRDDWPFFYMSRNRRALWDSPSFAIQADPRHIALHPSSPPMRYVEKDHWEFTKDKSLYRRLSVRECARIQTFPDWYEFKGCLDSQYRQIGNAVPPMLAKIIAESIAVQIHRKAPQVGYEEFENREIYQTTAPLVH